MPFINRTKFSIFILYGKAVVLRHSFTMSLREKRGAKAEWARRSNFPETLSYPCDFFCINVTQFLVNSTDINTHEMEGVIAYFVHIFDF